MHFKALFSFSITGRHAMLRDNVILCVLGLVLVPTSLGAVARLKPQLMLYRFGLEVTTVCSLVVRILPATLFVLGVVALLLYISLRTTPRVEAVPDECDVSEPLLPVPILQERKMDVEASYDIAFKGTSVNLPNVVEVSKIQNRTDQLIQTFLRKRTSLPLLVSALPHPAPDEGLLLQIASDLHIEMLCESTTLSQSEKEKMLDEMIVPKAPFLILAGDIGCPGTFLGEPFLRAFLEKQSQRFRYVFFIAGNHEYYSDMSSSTGIHMTVPDVHTLMKQICASFPNVVLLDRKAALIGGVRLVGATLWTDVSVEHAGEIEEFVSDYKRMHLPAHTKSPFGATRKMEVSDGRAWHKHDVSFIKEQIEQAERLNQEVVIITHHSPSFRDTSHRCHSHSALSSAFSCNLEHMMKPPVRAWIFGHTHYCSDQLINGVRLVANQRGYYYDCEDNYRSDFVIQI